jgi:hypothetical protein
MGKGEVLNLTLNPNLTLSDGMPIDEWEED